MFAGVKLLVVEDTASLRATLMESLREEGFAVDGAADGTEALYKVENWDYDAVILDVMLPGLDGFTVLERLREKKDTPVLMLTARDALADRVRGLDRGADDYLTKPFDLIELHARVRAITRRGRGAARPRIEVGGVVVDTVRREVRREGVVVEMTEREYAIVEALVLNRGRPVSRAFLYEHLYAEDDDTLSNILDVYICRLRAKLGKDFIRTRRGFGYVVDEGAAT